MAVRVVRRGSKMTEHDVPTLSGADDASVVRDTLSYTARSGRLWTRTTSFEGQVDPVEMWARTVLLEAGHDPNRHGSIWRDDEDSALDYACRLLGLLSLTRQAIERYDARAAAYRALDRKSVV